MDEKSVIEKVSGSLVIGTALTATTTVAAASNPAFGPALALVPFLATSLAAGRQEKRIKKCLQDIEEDLAQLKCNLEQITDDQFKFVTECVGFIYSTINAEKMEYLRRAVLNCLSNPQIPDGLSDMLARLVRDISAAETVMVIKSFGCPRVAIGSDSNANARAGWLFVQRGSPEEITITGLIRLGLLLADEDTWDASVYSWSPITAKFIALTKTAPTAPSPSHSG